MKPSAYNHLTSLSDETGLLFNFYTLRLVELTPHQAEAVRGIFAKPGAVPGKKVDARLRAMLIDKGFLITDSVIELDYLKHFHREATIHSRNLSLTILPTLACNFRCGYCYEKSDPTYMGASVQDALVSLVRQRTVDDGSLSVTWFGGEPLLGMDIIENLSKAFMGICEQRKARYSASIVTNGSLFTKTTAQRLARIKVNRVQVTLDGPPGIHVSRRPTTSGGKTFARILRNLRAASPVLPVSLRINVDHTNRGHLAAVLDIIEESGLKNTVHPYLGHTLPYSDVCRDVAGCCLSDQDFALLGLETDLELARRGFRSFRMLKPVNVYCMADMASSYAITPRGAVMKCWSEGANEEAAVGHLLEDFTERMQANMRRWQGRDPFSLECAGCILLPVCMGGCPYLYLKTGRLHCHDWKHHMNESLAIYYYLQKLRQEGDIVKRLLSVVEEVKELSVASKTGSEQE